MKWYAVHCKSRSEELAKENLEWKGYQVFFPHYCEFQRRRYIIVPYFSRYLFVAFQGKSHESAYDVNETDGVSTMVYAGSDANGYKVPFPIPQDVMDDITDMADPTGQIFLRKAKLPPVIAPGARVRVSNEGNAAFNFLGEVERVMGKWARVKLEQALLGNVYATIATDDLEVSLAT